MRILLTGILIFVNFILQTTLLPYISIGGILPNTALIIVVSYALLRGSTEGAIVGFFSGLPIDIFFGTSFGYYTLLFLLAGLLIGRSQKDFYRENYLLPIIICSLAAIVYESIIFITGFFLQGNTTVLYFLVRAKAEYLSYCAGFVCFFSYCSSVCFFCRSSTGRNTMSHCSPAYPRRSMCPHLAATSMTATADHWRKTKRLIPF